MVDDKGGMSEVSLVLFNLNFQRCCPYIRSPNFLNTGGRGKILSLVVMGTMKDSQEDFVVDTSLSILFEPANSRTSCKANDAKSSNASNKADNNEDVEKLVQLLNNYANWELRTLLVGILKDNKISALQERLLGNIPGETNREEQSSGSDNSPVASGLADPCNVSSEPDSLAQRSQRSHDHRASGSGSRHGSRPGRLTRSLSSERKLDAARRPNRESALSARQASILAKRRELDRQKQESSGADRDESPKEREVEHTKPARRNRSLSPARNLRRSLDQAKSLGKDNKSGSADNLLGLASHSFHVPGSRRGLHNMRGTRNATFGLPIASAHTSGSAERIGTSRGLSPTPMARNAPRRHSKEQIEVRSSPTAGRRRLLATAKALNHNRDSNTPPPAHHHRESQHNRDSNTPPPVHHHRESHTHTPPPMSHHRESKSSNANVNRHRESNTPPEFSPPSVSRGGMDNNNGNFDDSAFLQFTVNPISNQENLTFFATSSRALNNANGIVEELRSSTHDPINVVVGQPTEPSNSDVNPNTSCSEKVSKRGFDMLLRRKWSQLEKLKDRHSACDHGSLLGHDDSDEESFS